MKNQQTVEHNVSCNVLHFIAMRTFVLQDMSPAWSMSVPAGR